jgi:hypothetical protein
MLGTEGYGQVLIAPRGGRVIVERRGPYEEGARFSYGFMSRRMTSKVMIFDSMKPGSLAPAFEQSDDAGYWAGDFSPSGARLTVFRLQNDRLSLGVLDVEEREVRWLAGAPDLPISLPAPVWIDDHRFVYIRFVNDRLPTILDGASAVQNVMTARWNDAATGRIAAADLTATRSSGPNRYEQRELVIADVSTGTHRTLASGEISEFQVSSDHRSVAIIELTEPVTPDAGRLISFATPNRRHRLRMVDVVTGHAFTPCPECDLQKGSLNFSTAGRLAVIARRDGATWEAAQPFLLFNEKLVAGPRPTFPTESIVWSGEALLMLSGGDNWSIITSVSKPEVKDLGTFTLVAASGGLVWLLNKDGLWRLGPSSRRKKVADAAPAVDLDFQDANSAGSQRFNRPDVPIIRTRRGLLDELEFGFEGTVPTTLRLGHSTQVLAVSGKGGFAVELMRDDHGVGRLYLASSRGKPRQLDTISARLADVAPPKAIPLKRLEGKLGVVDWLLLPMGRGPFPLVVSPYQGQVYDGELPSVARPGGLSPAFEPALLTAKGYAVLLPSISEGPLGHPQDGLLTELDAAVDGAVATGMVDASRMAIHGHSFGGINALTIATRSSRYRAIISSSGISEFGGAYGSLTPMQKISLAGGGTFGGSVGWYESGQGRLDGAPWSVPQNYIRASSLFEADRIQTPLLLIAAELDFFPMDQAERMFVGLSRLGKDATLLRIFGDGHIRQSPGNIKFEWETIFSFLSDKMSRGIEAGKKRPQDQ